MNDLRVRGWWICAQRAPRVGVRSRYSSRPPSRRWRCQSSLRPATATVPLPNSAALDPDGTLPKLESARGEESAEDAFYQYLDSFYGWSPLTPIEVPFSGTLDEESITTDSVKLYQVDGETLTELEATTAYAENDEAGSLCNPVDCVSEIWVIPAAPLVPGTQYAVLVTNDVLATDGSPVQPDLAVFFGLSNDPIFEDGEVKLGLLADDPETAQSLEAIRQQLTPIRAGLEVDRDQIASLFTWTVVSNSFTVLDPVTATIPIPNTLALDSDGTFPSAALTYCGGPGFDPFTADQSCGAPEPEFVACEEASDCPTGEGNFTCIGGRCLSARCAQGDFDAYLDGLHGWPDTTPITLPFAGTIREDTLNDTNVQLWTNIDGTWTKVDGTTVGFDECGEQILITPPEPMALNRPYIAFATRDLLSEVNDFEGNALPVLPRTNSFWEFNRTTFWNRTAPRVTPPLSERRVMAEASAHHSPVTPRRSNVVSRRSATCRPRVRLRSTRFDRCSAERRKRSKRSPVSIGPSSRLRGRGTPGPIRSRRSTRPTASSASRTRF